MRRMTKACITFYVTRYDSAACHYLSLLLLQPTCDNVSVELFFLESETSADRPTPILSFTSRITEEDAISVRSQSLVVCVPPHDLRQGSSDSRSPLRSQRGIAYREGSADV